MPRRGHGRRGWPPPARPERQDVDVAIVSLPRPVGVDTGSARHDHQPVSLSDDLLELAVEALGPLALEGVLELVAAVKDLWLRISLGWVEVGPLQVGIDERQNRRDVSSRVTLVRLADERRIVGAHRINIRQDGVEDEDANGRSIDRMTVSGSRS